MGYMPKCVFHEVSLCHSLKGQAGLPINSNFSKLTDFWQFKTDSSNAFGGALVLHQYVLMVNLLQ